LNTMKNTEHEMKYLITAYRPINGLLIKVWSAANLTERDMLDLTTGSPYMIVVETMLPI